MTEQEEMNRRHKEEQQLLERYLYEMESGNPKYHSAIAAVATQTMHLGHMAELTSYQVETWEHRFSATINDEEKEEIDNQGIG